MEKRKINISDSDLNDDEINKYKDFKKLNIKYKNSITPLFKLKLYSIKNKKYFLIILLIITLILIFFGE